MAYSSKGHSRTTNYRNLKKAVNNHLKDISPVNSFTSTFLDPQFVSIPLPSTSTSTPEGPSYSNTSIERIEPNIDLGSESTGSQSDVSQDSERYFSTDQNSSDKSDAPVTDFNLQEFLRNWSIENRITLHATSQLLKGLKHIQKDLPLDARTLLQTPRIVLIEKMGNGEFVYFGIKNMLEKNAYNFPSNHVTLALNFNIDGIPLFKSSQTEFWPILCSVQDYDTVAPFPIAIFCGTGKPPIDEYFKEFVAELKHLLEHGFVCAGISFKLWVRAFIADAPAKAYMRCVKLYSGYYGCDRCTTKGSFFGRVTFPDVSAPLRTDDTFKLCIDENFHHRQSPLADLNIGLVSTFPLDYMHLVCLGVMKRLIQFWLRGMKGVRVKHARMSVAYQNALSAYLFESRKVWPSDFCRKPRGVNDVDRWKATELRQFLLYLSVTSLKGLLPDDVFEHFLYLHCAISILTSNMHIKLNALANELLTKFVTKASSFYGDEFIVSNVHALIHLSSDALRLGRLDTFGAFKFENQLGLMKRDLRSKSKPLQQLCKRIVERELCSNDKKEKIDSICALNLHANGPTAGHDGKQFQKILCPKFQLSTQPRDRTVILNDGSVMLIRNFISCGDETILVVGSVYKKYSDFYTTPIRSSVISVYFAEKLSNVLNVVELSSVESKAVSLPYKNGVVVFPLLHSP